MVKGITVLRSSLVFLLIAWSCVSYAAQHPEINITKKWYGETYRVGEVEKGFWGRVKEAREVDALIRSDTKANLAWKKAKIINNVSLAVVLAYLIVGGQDNNDSSNDDAKDSFNDYLKLTPLIFGAGYIAERYSNKAVRIYNAGIETQASLTTTGASLGWVYRF